MLEDWLRSARRQWLLSVLLLTPFIAVAGAQVRLAHAGGTSAGQATSSVEVTSLRTEMADTFQNPDGSRTIREYGEPVNYRDASGAWSPIDSRLVGSRTPGFGYENAANAFKVRFANSPGGTFSEFESSAGRVGISLTGVSQGDLVAAPAALTASSSGELVYPSVEPGVNLAYRMTAIGVKESVVLTDSSAASSYSFLLHPESGQQLTAKVAADGSWRFVDASGTEAFRLAAPLVSESSRPVTPAQCSASVGGAPPVCVGGPADADTPPAPTPVAGIGADDGSSAVVTARGVGSLAVAPVGSDFKVTVGVDPAWLSSPKRVFPVVLDPTVVLRDGNETDGTFQIDCSTCTPTMSSTSDHAEVGSDWTHSYEWVAQFNASSVPGGSKIVSATLSATFDQCVPATSYPTWEYGCTWSWPWQSYTLSARRVTAPWSSSTTTAGLMVDSSNISSDSFFAGYPGSGGITPRTKDELQWSLTQLVQGWSNHLYANNGIAIVNSQADCGSFSGGNRCGVFIPDSSYTSDTTLRPHLDIVYTPTLGSDASFPMWSNGPIAVNEATGNLVLSPPSPSFPTAVGTLGLPVAYNSFNTSTAGSPPLGTGWSFGLGSWLVDHSPLGDSKSIEQFAADGSSVVFTQVGTSNVFLASDGSNSTLLKNTSSAYAYTVAEGDGSVWTYGAADGTSGVAPVLDVETLAANTGTGVLSYAFTAGKLTSVTAKDGSTTIAALALNWSCSGALVCVTGPDGQVWQYKGTSGSAGPLQTVSDGVRDVFKVTYDGSGRPSTVQNADDLTPPPGYSSSHSLTIGFDSVGRVASVANGPITGQTPSTSTWSFAYSPDPTGATTTDAVANTHGTSGQPGYVAAGTHRSSAGYTVVTTPCEQTTTTCAGHGSGGTKTIKVYYDAGSQTLERVELPGTDGVAHYVQTGYNPNVSGQALWSEDEDGNPTDYAYDPTDNTLTSVTAPDPDGAGPAPRPVTINNYDETKYGSVSGSTYTPGAALQGVQAAYYKTQNFVSSVNTGRPDASTTELGGGSFSFSWGATGPSALYSSGTHTNYSVRFLGDLTIPAGSTPTIEFETFAEGGTQLVVDNYDLVENLVGAGTTTQVGAGAINLAPGKHRFVLNYVETTAR